MTREEAKTLIYQNQEPLDPDEFEFAIEVSKIAGVLDKIYDDFESKTCEGCKLQYDKYCPIVEINHDFKYCSEWEAKSD